MTTATRYKARNITEMRRSAVGTSAINTVKTLVLDLGAQNSFTKIIGVKRGLSSAGESLLIEQAHDGDQVNPTWVSCPNAALTGLVSSPSSGTDMVLAAVPTARWVRVKHTNGATAQTGLVLELTAQG